MAFANEIGLSPLPIINFTAMLIIVATYIITANILKVWFLKR
ncbi:hypothetical protein HJ01_00086 [Flavobacterium frigoris PS1]|uniref:Uncharacterized protein n=1 Tax=Flavobacterium frigoris (strain PS1) TaxID=1086011 RepID=H7FLN8_FLAFP|nr:hypothetical protein HJ01_00086 [Flavobacterium frigoris PS1]